MARRTTTRSRRIPGGGTTIHIPAQRGRRGRHGTPQVLLVMPERHASLAERAAAAAARRAWQGRRTCRPIWIAIAVFLGTCVVHVLAPWLWILLAAVTVSGPVAAAWLHYRRPADKAATRWRLAFAIAAFLAGLWLTAAVASSPFAPGLPAFWLLLTGGAQVAWYWLRRPVGPVSTSDEGVSK